MHPLLGSQPGRLHGESGGGECELHSRLLRQRQQSNLLRLQRRVGQVRPGEAAQAKRDSTAAAGKQQQRLVTAVLIFSASVLLQPAGPPALQFVTTKLER